MKTSLHLPIAISALVLFASCSKDQLAGPAADRVLRQGDAPEYNVVFEHEALLESVELEGYAILLDLSWRQLVIDEPLYKGVVFMDSRGEISRLGTIGRSAEAAAPSSLIDGFRFDMTGTRLAQIIHDNPDDLRFFVDGSTLSGDAIEVQVELVKEGI